MLYFFMSMNPILTFLNKILRKVSQRKVNYAQENPVEWNSFKSSGKLKDL